MFGPVRTIILAAALYLPMSLFVWFLFAQLVVQPVLWLSKLILTNWLPDIFVGVDRNKYIFDWITTLPVAAQQMAEGGGKAVAVTVTTNPMIYGYGLPVFAGLVLATPISLRNRLKQIGIAALVIWLVQTNGVVWEAIKHVCFSTGPVGMEALAKHGLTPNLVALMYQLGYLILSPLPPILLWIILNRMFIEKLLVVDTLEEMDEDQAVPASNNPEATSNEPARSDQS